MFGDRLAPRDPGQKASGDPHLACWLCQCGRGLGQAVAQTLDCLPLCLAVSLELGDVSLVSVHCEGLQPTPDGNSRGQLLAQLQELLHRWVLWAAVKSRWVIVGECAPVPSRRPAHPHTPHPTGNKHGEWSSSQRSEHGLFSASSSSWVGCPRTASASAYRQPCTRQENRVLWLGPGVD